MAVNATDLYNYVNNLISSYTMTMKCYRTGLGIGFPALGVVNPYTEFT